jgi:hypothetical protein
MSLINLTTGKVELNRKLFEGSSMAEALNAASDSLAIIIADAVYPLEVFKVRTGLETASIRNMRRQGFVVRRIGRRSFVSGREFIAWAENVLSRHSSSTSCDDVIAYYLHLKNRLVVATLSVRPSKLRQSLK